jgi:hypothetical protein
MSCFWILHPALALTPNIRCFMTLLHGNLNPDLQYVEPLNGGMHSHNYVLSSLLPVCVTSVQTLYRHRSQIYFQMLDALA